MEDLSSFVQGSAAGTTTKLRILAVILIGNAIEKM